MIWENIGKENIWIDEKQGEIAFLLHLPKFPNIATTKTEFLAGIKFFEPDLA